MLQPFQHAPAAASPPPGHWRSRRSSDASSAASRSISASASIFCRSRLFDARGGVDQLLPQGLRLRRQRVAFLLGGGELRAGLASVPMTGFSAAAALDGSLASALPAARGSDPSALRRRLCRRAADGAGRGVGTIDVHCVRLRLQSRRRPAMTASRQRRQQRQKKMRRRASRALSPERMSRHHRRLVAAPSGPAASARHRPAGHSPAARLWARRTR